MITSLTTPTATGLDWTLDWTLEKMYFCKAYKLDCKQTTSVNKQNFLNKLQCFFKKWFTSLLEVYKLVHVSSL